MVFGFRCALLPLLLALVSVVAVPLAGSAQTRTAPDAFTKENNVNRPGQDLEQIVMEPGRRAQCEEECRNNPLCVAYTWVRPNVSGPKPVCWLKAEASAGKASDCCISGKRVSTGPTFRGTREPSVDLTGRDYRQAVLPRADPALCAAACGRDGDCRSYTYVKPGVQGDKAVCYLKDSVPVRKVDSDCCVSGIKANALTTLRHLPDRDLPGGDYADFDVGGAAECVLACRDDAQCRAATYRKTTSTSSVGHCWLKNAVPNGVDNSRFSSWVKERGSEAMNISRANADLPGEDYVHIFPTGNETQATQICKDSCGADSRCRAFAFVKAGVQSPNAVCYLKDKVPAQGRNDSCCSSGTKRGDRIGKPVSSSGVPLTVEFSANDPNRIIANRSYPADMPAVRFPSDFTNCSLGERWIIETAWARAHYNLWRAHQLIQHISRQGDLRDDMWEYGFIPQMHLPGQTDYANVAPRAYFGSFDSKRFRMVRRAIDKAFNERFRGKTFEVQCRQRNLDGAHPCNTVNPSANTSVYGKINFCVAFFGRSEQQQAKTVVHEVFHWLKIPQSGYWVTDRHDFWRSCSRYKGVRALYGDDAIYLGMDRGCRDWNHNRAVRANDTYAWFATTLGDRIYGGRLRRFPAEDF